MAYGMWYWTAQMFPGKHVLVDGVVVSTELDRWFIYADLRMVFGIAGACDCFTSFGTFICHDMTRLGFRRLRP